MMKKRAKEQKGGNKEEEKTRKGVRMGWCEGGEEMRKGGGVKGDLKNTEGGGEWGRKVSTTPRGRTRLSC